MHHLQKNESESGYEYCQTSPDLFRGKDDGVVPVAFDIGDFTVLKVDVYSATTGAHVTCGLPDFV